MESSDEETDSGALGPAYSLTDMLDELGSEGTSGVTSPVPSEEPSSPSHQQQPVDGSPATTTTTSGSTAATSQPGGNINKTATQTATSTTTSTATTTNAAETTRSKGQGQPEVTSVKDAAAIKGDEIPVKAVVETATSGEILTTTCGREPSVEKTASDTITNHVTSSRAEENFTKPAEKVAGPQPGERETETMKTENKLNGNVEVEVKVAPQNDVNGNDADVTTTDVTRADVTEVVSEENSEDASTATKDDPVWRRKKVIKRRRPKRSLTSQSSTGSAESEGSTSSIGSMNGVVPGPGDVKATTPDRECNPPGEKGSLRGKMQVHLENESLDESDISQINKVNGQKEDLNKVVDGGSKDGSMKVETENSVSDTKTGESDTTTGNDKNGDVESTSGNGGSGSGPAVPGCTEFDENSGYEPYEFRPLGQDGRVDGGLREEDIYQNVPDSALYENVAGRADPRRSTLRRGATLKGLSHEDLVSMTYQGSMKVVKVLPDEHPSRSDDNATHDGDMKGAGSERTLTRTPDNIYETLNLMRAPLSPTTPPVGDDEYDDFSWGSSEFESYDEDEDAPPDGAPLPISVTVEVKSRSSQEPTNQNVLNKLAARIGPRSWSREDDEDTSTYLEVTLNMEKHPPPELPPAPPDLTPQQVKRRHIVASVVESERSYTDSLRRIIDEYEKPLLLAKPQIISKNHIKVIFYRLRDILQCHNMFHIELAEHIRVWDAQEKLGNVFTASFSKSMVFDVYSEFVNNFTLAMETAKKLAKQKQTFADFLKLKIQNSPDKLSLFGLMVKPIQRFPQFILCLQDLLKHTSRDHHDRLALQLALTELETLTHKLNEMKRESENRHEVKKIQSAMTGRFSFKQDNNRCLVRQDDMIQLDCHAGSRKTKSRRLFLMNDQLICATVVQKDGETGLAEKFKFKWSIPVRDVEVVESEMPDLYQVQGGPGRSLIVAPKLDRSTVSPWKKELDDMMHDLAVIEQLSNLTSQLRLNYPGLNTDLLFGIQRGLQLSIQDQGDLDLCILHLSLPTKYLQTSTDKIKEEMSKHMTKHMSRHIPHRPRPDRASRMLHTFQVQSASIKQEWLMDLKNAKLSLDPHNKPGWYVPETDHGHCLRLPLFVKPLLIDITKQNTKIQCAIPVVLPSFTNPYVGVQHLWVCSNEARHGQVTIVSLHATQPHVLESFTACDAPIVCAEYVPGYGAGFSHEHCFPQDTVWMAMESNELCVRSVAEDERAEEPLLVMDTDGDLTCLRFMDSRLYAGLAGGRLAIYSRDRDGVWQIEDRLLVDLGTSAVNSLLPLNHDMWVACDNKVHIVHVTARWRAGSLQHDVRTTAHEVGSAEEEVLCMVKAGVGLMVSFRGRGVIRIYNQETFNHLQDVNVASAVAKILEGKDLGDLNINPRRVAITFMLASKGLLWIGTDCGCTLTLPLPRLEGVPQIKGRPSVSYHAHLGPIRFIVPIHCGPCQLHAPPTSPLSNQSQAYPSENDLDGQSDGGSDIDGRAEGDLPGNGHSLVTVEGATESDTNCDDSYESEEQQAQPLEDPEDADASFVEELSLKKGCKDHLSTSMLHLPQQRGTIGQTKWTSTPDLRHGSAINLNDSEEDVINLYNNLLQGAEYAKYDDELMGGRRRRRPQSESGYPPLLGDDDPRLVLQRGLIGVRTHRRASKYATLPVVIEDSTAYTVDATIPEDDLQDPAADQSFSTESSGDVSPGLTPSNDSHTELVRNASSRTSSKVIYPGHPPVTPSPSTISRMSPAQKSLSKSVMIVTGGEGHINWADKNAGDNRYDDICLLLWQCRV